MNIINPNLKKDEIIEIADLAIVSPIHQILRFKCNYSTKVWKIAQYHKKICMENLYSWKTMDQDLLEEAADIIKENNVPG
jgi:hypothetical protein|tara:strand:- start:2570 stop:2809 length:240 start_codon:yes stop_codon:yes gene_type:complete